MDSMENSLNNNIISCEKCNLKLCRKKEGAVIVFQKPKGRIFHYIVVEFSSTVRVICCNIGYNINVNGLTGTTMITTAAI